MPLKLPDFRNTLCQAFVSCGMIRPDEGEPLSVLAEVNAALTAEYPSGRGRRYLTVVLGRDYKEHLHIDVCRKRAYRIGPDREPDSTLERIQVYLDRLIGATIRAAVLGRFVIPAENLPDRGLIRLLSFGGRRDEFEITTTGGSFEIRGKGHYAISWRLIEKKKKIQVEVETHVETEIDENYVVGLYDLINGAFRLYVLGEPPNDNES